MLKKTIVVGTSSVASRSTAGGVFAVDPPPVIKTYSMNIPDEFCLCVRWTCELFLLFRFERTTSTESFLLSGFTVGQGIL